MARVTSPRSRERGTAAIEMILAAPVLLLSMVVMFDFARGFRASQEGERAARHLAWGTVRAREGVATSAPGPGELKRHHYHADGSVVGSWTGDGAERHALGSSNLQSNRHRPMLQRIGVNRSSRGALDFLDGLVEYTEGESAFRVAGLRIFAPGGAIRATHAVSVDSRREQDPDRPKGWWDPFSGAGGLLEEMRKRGLPW